MTYTKGPWIANDKHSGATLWRVESDATGYPNDGWIIAECLGPDAEANARLIAAAPALLEALDSALNFLESAPLESGTCCCGSPMDGHSYTDGHSPVDDLSYHAGRLEDHLRSAITQARGQANG